MRPEEVPVRLSHLWRWQEDVVVVVSDAHFNLVRLVLNQVGSKVWALMDGNTTVSAISEALSIEYPQVSADELAAGVSNFLEELRVEWLAMTREELTAYE
jgi:hypothetical protein